MKFINLLTAVEKIIVWVQNVSAQLNLKNLRFKRFNFVLNFSLMLISLTELEHRNNLPNKTPFFKKDVGNLGRKREDRNDVFKKSLLTENWEECNKLLSNVNVGCKTGSQKKAPCKKRITHKTVCYA